MKKHVWITFSLLSLFFLSSCKKDDASKGNFLTLTIGSARYEARTFALEGFDDSNNYSLSDNSIYFIADDCFQTGGQIYFNSSSLNSIVGFTALSLNTSSCRAYDAEYNSTTYSNVNITRNDNREGGILEGKISGKVFSMPLLSTNVSLGRYENFSIDFRLRIAE
jgi:hypothetical protein